MNETDYTLVSNGNAYALYVRTNGGRYTLADSGTDASGNAQRMARTMMQAAYGRKRFVEDLPHLNAGGDWRDSLSDEDFDAPTPRMRLEAEIKNLRADAERRRIDAGYSGSWSDNGASHLIDRADAIQHALNVIYGSEAV